LYGLAVTFTATASGAGATPTGQVTFYDGTTSLGTTPISNGDATLTTSTLTTGTHSITVQYGGDSNYLSSVSEPVAQTIELGASSTTMSSALNPSTHNQSVAFTANVTGTGGTPTGSITFNDGQSTMGTVPLTNGTATLNYSSLAAGVHNITASYSGDSTFQPGSS